MLKYCRPDGSCIEWEISPIKIRDIGFLLVLELYEKYLCSIYGIDLSELGFAEKEYAQS